MFRLRAKVAAGDKGEIIQHTTGLRVVRTLEKIPVPTRSKAVNLIVRTRQLDTVLPIQDLDSKGTDHGTSEGIIQTYESRDRLNGVLLTYGSNDSSILLLEDERKNRKLYQVPANGRDNVKPRTKWGFENGKVLYATTTHKNPVVYAKGMGIAFHDPNTNEWVSVPLDENELEVAFQPVGGSDFIFAFAGTTMVCVPEIAKRFKKDTQRVKWRWDVAKIIPDSIRIAKIVVSGEYARILVEVKTPKNQDDVEEEEEEVEDDDNAKMGATRLEAAMNAAG
jgi:hypothetical protein